MNSMKTVWPVMVAVLASGAAGIAHAQLPAGGPPGWNAAMTRLFGDVKAFSAKADMQELMIAIAQKQNQKGGQGGKNKRNRASMSRTVSNCPRMVVWAEVSDWLANKKRASYDARQPKQPNVTSFPPEG